MPVRINEVKLSYIGARSDKSFLFISVHNQFSIIIRVCVFAWLATAYQSEWYLVEASCWLCHMDSLASTHVHSCLHPTKTTYSTQYKSCQNQTTAT